MIYRERINVCLDLWEFFSKWGFGDGDDGFSYHPDPVPCHHVVEVLNRHLPEGIRAQVANVSSIHNECLISLVGDGGEIDPADRVSSDEELTLETAWPLPGIASALKEALIELRAEYVGEEMACLPVERVREVCQTALYALDPQRALLERGWWGHSDSDDATALLITFLESLPEA